MTTQQITDDHGQAILKQYRVVKSKGNLHLLCDIHVVGDKAVHEFRIQRITKDVQIYPGATLDYAMKRFEEISNEP